MVKKLFKTLCISFVIICGTFFIDLDGAKAMRCTCQYYGTKQNYDAQGYGSSAADIEVDVYLVEINLYDYKHKYTKSDIKYFGEANVHSRTGDYASYELGIGITRSMLKENTNITFHSNYNTNYKDVVNKQCSVEACNTIPVTFYSFNNSKEIALGSGALNPSAYKVSLHAVSKEEAEKSKNTEYGENVTGIGSNEADNDIEKIKGWGETNKDKKGDYSLDSIGDGCGAISEELRDLISMILWIIDIIAILILIIMTMINLIQAITGSDSEKFKDVFKHVRVRIIAVVLLLLLPVLVGGIIDLINDNADGEVKIGADGKPFCDIEK